MNKTRDHIFLFLCVICLGITTFNLINDDYDLIKTSFVVKVKSKTPLDNGKNAYHLRGDEKIIEVKQDVYEEVSLLDTIKLPKSAILNEFIVKKHQSFLHNIMTDEN